MARLNSTFRGANRLRRLLRALPDEATAEFRDVVKVSAQQVELVARGNVRVDTGLLRDSITSKISKDGLSARIGLIGVQAARDAFYGFFIEFGTSRHPAFPFLTPAAEDVRPSLKRNSARALDKAIDIAQRRAGSKDQ